MVVNKTGLTGSYDFALVVNLTAVTAFVLGLAEMIRPSSGASPQIAAAVGRRS